MGWTGIYKPYGQSFRETLEKQFNHAKGRVLDCSIIKRKTAYIAYEVIPTGQVFGLVVMIDFRPNTNDHCNFWYKDIDEAGGPFQVDCPTRILDLLTPTDSDYANNWRESCRQGKNINLEKSLDSALNL